MGVLKNKRYFIILLVAGLAIIFFTYYGITKINPLQQLFQLITGKSTSPSLQVTEQPPPKITIKIEKSKSGDILTIRWDNLPAHTAKIKIYRAKAGTNEFVLWKIINLTDVSQSSPGISYGGSGGGTGSGQFYGNTEMGILTMDLGKSPGDYNYYIQAVGSTPGTPDTGNGTNTSTTDTIFWESTTTTPEVVTPPPSSPGSQPPPPPTPTSTTEQPPPTTTSSTPPQGNPSTSTDITTPPQNQQPTTPSGIPYYTPQGTISGYGQPQTGTFWVQYTDNKIEIGWQDIPPGTDSFIVSRSQNTAGPWSQVLTQKNPTWSGPYSIKIVDDTVGIPYYYKMDVYRDGSITATYGPVYLPSL